MGISDLNGKTVWITGASSGIGREVAKQLADEGCKLAVSARSEDKLKELADECKGTEVEVLPMDVTNKERHEEVVESIKDTFGGLDIAFFNAGVYSRPDRPIDSSAIEKDYDVNLFGIVYGVEAALPLLQESPDGLLVGMSSASAYGPLPRASSYGSSKAAVKYLFDALRFEWDVKEIDVDLSVVCPGFVKTPMTEENEFPMPFLVEVDRAAEVIVQGIRKSKQEISFPWQLVLTLKFLNLLPRFLYNPLVRKVTGVS
ncbi:MAG: SDR family NAD(P)-dependent oxidoreductase [bacterium]